MKRIKSIKKVGIEEQQCLVVSAKDHLYVTDNNIITHNSPATRYSMALCSFTEKKASSLLFEPLQAIIEQAPLFEKVKFHDDIVKMNQQAQDDPHIFFTTATKTSLMEFTNGLDLRLIASSGGQVGQTLITASMTELAWWEDEGWSKEEIFNFFAKVKQRVDSRMKGNFLGRTMIDSSPYSLESPIDKWIMSEAMRDPKCFVIEGSRWKHYPEEFPEVTIQDDGSVKEHSFDVAFPLFKGNSRERPKVIELESELENYDPFDIIWCPKKQVGKGDNDIVDFKAEANTNAYEFLRNRAGYPAGSSDRLFNDPKMIEDIFDNDLPALYTAITAPADEDPVHLIWNKIAPTFFSIYSGSNYCLKRYESLPRALAVDQSETGDATGIALMHTEELDGKTCYVCDMLVMVAAKDGIPINLEAIKEFILDLIRIGHVPIRYASFDRYQSSSTVQSLKRAGVQVKNLSVDSNNSYYANTVNLIYNRLLKIGKNIFAKNNIRSLHMSKRKSGSMKYDHFEGAVVNFSENDNWETSQLGYNAKDGMDAITAAIGLIDEHASEFQPLVKWEPKKCELNTAVVTDQLAKLGLQF